MSKAEFEAAAKKEEESTSKNEDGEEEEKPQKKRISLISVDKQAWIIQKCL